MQINKTFILEKLVINPDKKKCFIFDLDGTIIFKNQFLSSEIDAPICDTVGFDAAHGPADQLVTTC